MIFEHEVDVLTFEIEANFISGTPSMHSDPYSKGEPEIDTVKMWYVIETPTRKTYIPLPREMVEDMMKNKGFSDIVNDHRDYMS
jgi:hypothetical protein